MSLWRRIYVEQKKIVLPLLVFLVANVAVLALGVVPLRRMVAGREQAKLDATLKLRDARVLEKNAKDQRAGKERADEQLKQFYTEILPNNLQGANEVAFWMGDQADNAGLRFKRSLMTPDDVKDSSLVKCKMTLTLTGDYPNIRKFLYAVETAEQFLVIERVALSPANELANSNKGSLEITMDIATYYLGTRGGR